jgi:L-threonylcarbamoyladenylate synthase
MKTLILEIDPRVYDPEVVRPAVEAVRGGGVIAFPTETFYGLGASAFSEGGIRDVYSLKDRDRQKPLSIVVADRASAESLAAEADPAFRALADAFWPGALTLVVKARPVFPPAMLGPGGTIALRVPRSPWLREFLGELGVPLTATSANLSGAGEVADPKEVIRQFDGRLTVILDGGQTPGGQASTVVDVTVRPPKILREGAIPSSRLASFLEA